ncbi:MAG: ComEC/Rec2 family competence protein [Spirochaetes bacterium]|nr:ComEC/Rec2 family competence protein [Spirochaetota bacterium]
MIRNVRYWILPIIFVSLMTAIVLIPENFKNNARLKSFVYICRWIEGSVNKVRQTKKSTIIHINVKKINILKLGIKKVEGKSIIIYKPSLKKIIHRKYRLKITGELEKIRMNGKYRNLKDHYKRKGLNTIIYNPVKTLIISRGAFSDRIINNIKESINGFLKPLGNKNSSLIKALLFGNKSGLSKKVRSNFTTAGILHVLAVSGLHVGIFAGLFLFIALKAGLCKKRAGIILFVVIPIYAARCSFSPSVSRASLMVLFYSAGMIFSGTALPFHSLSFAGIIILLIKPEVLYEPGFLLSFAATTGILLFTKKISQLPLIRKLPGFIKTGLSVSIAAQLTLIPILAGFFGRISILSPINNLIFVPMVFLVFFIGIICTVFLQIGFFPDLFYNLFNTSINFIFDLIGKSASIPFSQIKTGKFNLLAVILYYLLLLTIFKGKSIYEHYTSPDNIPKEFTSVFKRQ